MNLCTTPVTFNPVDGDCVRPLDQFYPDPNNPDPFGSVDIKKDIGSSTYHALDFTRAPLQQRSFVSSALYLLALHQRRFRRRRRIERAGNRNCLPCDIGPSIFDIRHNFTVNVVYELPFGPGKAFLNDSERSEKSSGAGV